jgi:hypothetical protein
MIGTTGRTAGHPLLDRALAVWPEDVAGRAADALRALLAGRTSWDGSPLTGGGFPVEINIASADDRLRCTVEPGPAGLDPRSRLDLAAAWVGVPAGTLATARRLQDGQLRYGAWIGCRHSAAGSRYKLYAEVGDRAGTAHPSGLPAPRAPARLRIVAGTPATGEREAYYRVPDLYPIEVPALLAAAGVEDRAAELLDLLAGAYGHSLTGRLPGDSVGVSYAVSATGAPLGVTLYFFARVFWGSDARIRRRLTRLAPALGWDDRRYRKLTAHLAGAGGRLTRHGLLGVSMPPAGPPVLSIGVRP